MHTLLRRLAVCGLIVFAAPAGATELMVGLGRDDIQKNNHPALAFTMGLRSAPFLEVAGLQFRGGLALETTSDADFWVGGGLVAMAPMGAWRWTLSTMVGYYDRGNGNDLRQDFPVFRGQFELDRSIAPGWRAGVALGHKSNGGTGSLNPGVETIYLTVTRTF